MVTKKELDKLISDVVSGVGVSPLSGVQMSNEDWAKLPERTKQNLLLTFTVTHYLDYKVFTRDAN